MNEVGQPIYSPQSAGPSVTNPRAGGLRRRRVVSGGANGIEYFIDRRRSISPCCCYWPTFIAVDWAGIDGWID